MSMEAGQGEVRGSQEKLTEIMRYLEDVDVSESVRNNDQFRSIVGGRGGVRELSPTSETVSGLGPGHIDYVWDKWSRENSSSTIQSINSRMSSPTCEPQAEDRERRDLMLPNDSRSATDSPLLRRRYDRDREERIQMGLTGETGPVRRRSSASSIDSRSTVKSTASTATAFREVQGKVSAMRKELGERQAEITSLRKELDAVRIAGVRAASLLEREYEESFETQRRKNSSAAGRQREMKDQLLKDVGILGEKEQKLKEKIEQHERARPAEVQALERGIAERLEQEKQHWFGLEKKRQQSLLSKEGAGLKEKAARALEPKVHELISNQVAEARSLTSDLDQERAKFEKGLLEGAERSQAEKRLKVRELWSKKRQHHRDRCQHLIVQELKRHQEELRRDAEQSRAEADAQAEQQTAARRKMERAHDDVIESVRAAAADRRSEVERVHSVEMGRRREMQHSKKVALRLELQEETEAIMGNLLKQLEQDWKEKLRRGTENYRDKVRKEVLMVKARLSAELEMKLTALRDETRRRGEELRSKSGVELDALERGGGEAFTRANELKRRGQTAERELRDVRREKEAATQRVERSREKLKGLEARFRESMVRKERVKERGRIRKVSAQEEHRLALSELEQRCEATTKLLHETEAACAERLKNLTAEHEGNLSQVMTKIDAVLEKKETEARRLGEELTVLQIHNDEKEDQLQEARSLQYN